MAEAVLDASAVLAFLQREPGAEIVRDMLPRSLLCSVNLAEIVGKLADAGVPASDAVTIAMTLPYAIVAFDENLACAAGLLSPLARQGVLSLGDRACLALAARERLPALTTDRRWPAENLEQEVRLIR